MTSIKTSNDNEKELVLALRKCSALFQILMVQLDIEPDKTFVSVKFEGNKGEINAGDIISECDDVLSKYKGIFK